MSSFLININLFFLSILVILNAHYDFNSSNLSPFSVYLFVIRSWLFQRISFVLYNLQKNQSFASEEVILHGFICEFLPRPDSVGSGSGTVQPLKVGCCNRCLCCSAVLFSNSDEYLTPGHLKIWRGLINSGIRLRMIIFFLRCRLMRKRSI